MKGVFRNRAFVPLWMLLCLTVSYGQTAQQIFSSTGVRYGLCVYLTPPGGKVLADLTNGGTMLVQGLTTDASKVEGLRGGIDDKTYGLASVIHVDSYGRLPYADNMVNLLVADLSALGSNAPSIAEIERVVAPYGAYYINQGGWSAKKVPLPSAMDEWSHWDRGPDGNATSRDSLLGLINSLKWHNCPNHQYYGNGYRKLLALMSGGNAVLSDFDYKPGWGTERKMGKNNIGPQKLFVRNAFNGILTRSTVVEQENIPEIIVLIGDTLFAPVKHKVDGSEKISKIHAKTGEVFLTYTNGLNYPFNASRTRADEIFPCDSVIHIQRVTNDYVIQVSGRKLVVLNRGNGSVVWSKDAPSGRGFGRMITNTEGTAVYQVWTQDETVFAWHSSGMESYDLDEIVAYDIKTGTELWRNNHASTVDNSGDSKYNGAPTHYFFAYDGGQIFVPWMPLPDGSPWYHMNFKYFALNASTGATQWKIDELVSTKGIMGGASPCIMGDYLVNTERGARTINRHTGAIGPTFNMQMSSSGCATGRASSGSNLILNGQLTKKVNPHGTFQELEPEKMPDAFRAGCDAGMFPAYGMHYGTNSGYWHADYIIGFAAFTNVKEILELPDNQRVVKGSASAPTGGTGGGWPVFRADAERGAAISGSLNSKLVINWITPIAAKHPGPIGSDWFETWTYTPGLLSGITGQGSLVYVTHPDAHRVYALDATDGTVRWRFTAGGRVNAPPSLYDGFCYVGCNDGWVYALRADNGQLVWKFLAARNHRLIGAGSQLESAWPVSSSLLIHKGTLYVNAGRHSSVDRGIHIWGLDPKTGAIKWKTRVDEHLDAGQDNPASYNDRTSRSLNHMLVSDGTDLYLTYFKLKDSYSDGELVDLSQVDVLTKNTIPTYPKIMYGNHLGLESRVHYVPPAYENNGNGGLQSFMSYGGGEGSRQIALDGGTAITKDAAAIAVVGGKVITAHEDGSIKVDGATLLKVPSPVIRNGLASFGGNIYAALENGSVVRIGDGPAVSVAQTGSDPSLLKPEIGTGWFRIGHAARVTVTLHNAQGRTVRTLFTGVAGVGRTDYSFGASHVARGVYTITLRCGNQRRTRQVLFQ